MSHSSQRAIHASHKHLDAVSEVWVTPRDLLDWLMPAPAQLRRKGRGRLQTQRIARAPLSELVMSMANADLSKVLANAAHRGDGLVFLAKRPALRAWLESVRNHPNTPMAMRSPVGHPCLYLRTPIARTEGYGINVRPWRVQITPVRCGPISG
ncbi:hypothetical protein [Luteibacter yeojuensis]